ncbi:hypothetical protein IKU74_02290 [bacterium]|nr:hypothetical protein [bacterium]
MKKLLLLSLILFLGSSVFAKNVDFEQVYRDLEVPTHKYVHNVDPGEYYDIQSTSWSPYPLFRLASPIYFKSITIEPGYYSLTPREHKGEWYILFKDNGKIKYIIPTYNREIVPMGFYEDHIPQPKMTISQKLHLKALDTIGKVFPSSQRKPTPQAYLESTDLEHHYLSLVIYWGNYRYYTIFRTIQL